MTAVGPVGALLAEAAGCGDGIRFGVQPGGGSHATRETDLTLYELGGLLPPSIGQTVLTDGGTQPAGGSQSSRGGGLGLYPPGLFLPPRMPSRPRRPHPSDAVVEPAAPLNMVTS